MALNSKLELRKEFELRVERKLELLCGRSKIRSPLLDFLGMFALELKVACNYTLELCKE